jgi:hypothetical protein
MALVRERTIPTERPPPVGEVTLPLLNLQEQLSVFVFMGVRGKPRMYCSLLAYCTARFGRSNFCYQMPPTLAAEVGTYGQGKKDR